LRRDALDWATLAVALAAGATAIIGFTYWILEQRRRPEVSFLWRIALNGDLDGLRDWPHDESPSIEVGQTILVEASVQNVGDAPGQHTLTNFVVPSCFALADYPAASQRVLESSNDTAGLPQDRSVRFIAGERPFNISMWWMQRFALTLERDPGSDGARLLMALDEGRLNGRGRRLLPSLVAPHNPPGAPYGTPWPPPGQPRALAIIEAAPRDTVYCTRGSRQSVRDLFVNRSP
jgi:hypothetical protein